MTPTRIVLALGWVVVVWVALWGQLSVANVLSGLVVGGFTLWLVPLSPVGNAPATVRPVAAVRFVLFFLFALVRASAVVAWEIVTPRNRIHQGIVELRLRTASKGLATLIANAISLTPGTLTLEVRDDPLTLYVHVLHLRRMEVVRDDLRRLETLALSAFDRDFRTGGEPS